MVNLQAVTSKDCDGTNQQGKRSVVGLMSEKPGAVSNGL